MLLNLTLIEFNSLVLRANSTVTERAQSSKETESKNYRDILQTRKIFCYIVHAA
jgi:hypothetical protein